MLEYLTSSTASLKVNHQRGASNGAVGVVSDGNGRDFVVGDVDGSSRRSSSDSEKRPASILVTPSTLRSRDRDPNKRQRSVSFALPANGLQDTTGESSSFSPRGDREVSSLSNDNAQAVLPPRACVFVAKSVLGQHPGVDSLLTLS